MNRNLLLSLLTLSLWLILPACNTPADGGLDTDTEVESETGPEQLQNCSPIENHTNWELCAADESRCIAVFSDGSGCQEVCRSVNLGCAEIWDNTECECAADTSKSELGCETLTGHDSDYCVCSGPPTEIPEESSETEDFEDLLAE